VDINIVSHDNDSIWIRADDAPTWYAMMRLHRRRNIYSVRS